MIAVLIASGDLVIRKGLRHVLEEAGGINVIGEAQTDEEAIEWMKESPADIVLMDICMPGTGGIKVTRKIMRLRPQTKVLILSITDKIPTRWQEPFGPGPEDASGMIPFLRSKSYTPYTRLPQATRSLCPRP